MSMRFQLAASLFICCALQIPSIASAETPEPAAPPPASTGQRVQALVAKVSVCSSDPEVHAQLQAIGRLHGDIPIELGFQEERSYQAQLKRTHDPQYGERKSTFPLPDITRLEQDYLDAWRNPPTLSDGMMKFFDNYVHDSRASFMDIGNGGYLIPRKLITAAGKPSSFNPVRTEVAVRAKAA